MSSKNVLGAVKWSFAGELCVRAVLPIVFIAMAKLLTPADFGIAAAGLMAISFSQIFWEGGLAKAIIQRQSNVEAAASTAFWMNAVLGFVVATILFVVAPYIATFIFHDDRIAAVLRVMVLHILLGSLASIPTAIIQKNMRFDRVFWIRLVTVVAPSLLSIPLALAGWSYWALVVGALAGQCSQTIVVWWVGKWRPAFSFDLALAAEIFRFGRWSALSGLLSWLYIWADAAVVGFYFGSHEFGLYRTGSQAVTMMYGLIFAPILPVLYSHFSGFAGDRERISVILGNVMRVLAVTAIPLAFGIFIFSDLLERLFFGPQWHGVAFVLGVMALTQGYSWVVGADGEAYRALGKPSYETIIPAVSLVIYLAGYMISIRYGFEAFVWTRFGVVLPAVAFHLYLNWRVLKVDVSAVLGRLFFLTLAGLALYCTSRIGSFAVEFWTRLFVTLLSMSALVFSILMLHLKGDFGHLWNLAKRGARSQW